MKLATWMQSAKGRATAQHHPSTTTLILSSIASDGGGGEAELYGSKVVESSGAKVTV